MHMKNAIITPSKNVGRKYCIQIRCVERQQTTYTIDAHTHQGCTAWFNALLRSSKLHIELEEKTNGIYYA